MFFNLIGSVVDQLFGTHVRRLEIGLTAKSRQNYSLPTSVITYGNQGKKKKNIEVRYWFSREIIIRRKKTN